MFVPSENIKSSFGVLLTPSDASHYLLQQTESYPQILNLEAIIIFKFNNTS